MGKLDRAKTVSSARPRLAEIAGVFFKLGIFGFGGPVATMAMMEEQAVRNRQWVSPEEFGEIYAVCKLLPGPVATQMAIYLGRVRGGTLGGLVSGSLFILPCFLMVLGLAVIYAETGVVHGADAVLGGLQAAALAIILLSTWALGKAYRSQARSWLIAAACAAAVYRNPGVEPLLILGFGLIGAARAQVGATRVRSAAVVGGALATGGLLAGRTALASVWSMPAHPRVLWQLFWMCAKAGMFVFGTGLAVVPVLEADAVSKFGWLTHSQFMDGLAVGQVTPGPVVITSTFIGYLAAKMPGALAATFGMFLPAFVNVLFLVPRIWRKFSGKPGAKGFSAFAIPAVIGGILGTTTRLGLLTLTGWQPMAVFAASLIASIWLKPPAWLLIPLAGVAGGLLGR